MIKIAHNHLNSKEMDAFTRMLKQRMIKEIISIAKFNAGLQQLNFYLMFLFLSLCNY
jgi:hypothetical protein